MDTTTEVDNLRIGELKLDGTGNDSDQSCEWNGNISIESPSQTGEVVSIVKDSEGNCMEETPDELNVAPMEILAEFLSSLMSRDYESALVYCEQILEYEPNNKTAQEIYPLIQQKIKLELEANELGSSSDEHSEECQGESEGGESDSSEYYSSAVASGDDHASSNSSSSKSESDSSDETSD